MANINLPQIDQKAIKRRARENSIAYTLYHPGKVWFIYPYSGNFYAFPPDLGGKLVDHPFKREADGSPTRVPADGLLHLKDRYGVVYGKRAVPTTHPVYGYPMGMALPVLDSEGKVEEETADKVVLFFTQKFGSNALDPSMSIGIVLLSGDEAMDAEIKVLAQRLNIQAQQKWAEAEKATRLDDIEKWKKAHPGQNNIPPMSPRQRRAMEVLLLAENNVIASTMKHVCECGTFETDNSDLYKKHQFLAHQKEWSPKKVGRPKAADELEEGDGI